MTTKSIHTAGPWTVREAYDNGEPCGYVVQSGVNAIADVPQGEADAQLIASAPDLLRQRDELLEAIKGIAGLANTLGNWLPDIRKICATAIATAEGEPEMYWNKSSAQWLPMQAGKGQS